MLLQRAYHASGKAKFRDSRHSQPFELDELNVKTFGGKIAEEWAVSGLEEKAARMGWPSVMPFAFIAIEAEEEVIAVEIAFRAPSETVGLFLLRRRRLVRRHSGD